MTDSDELHLRQTGEEAERLLRELERESGPSGPWRTPPPGRRRDDPTVAITAEEDEEPYLPVPRARRRRRGPSSCLLTLISVAAGLAGVLFVAPWLSGLLDRIPGSLGYSTSCGSPGSASGEWWPVLGPPDPQVLEMVRERYCGDAFINASGVLQVASFGDPRQAENFAGRLERASGVPFRVGESFLP